ncbi:MAG: choice-of-anchor J domain-containing protein [Bacteroidales bacterium]|nr:choice-of-anchor J domain-containing protein [Bacteroidales bacterium]
MKTKNILFAIIAILGLSLSFSSCVKQDFDDPPTNCNDINITTTMSIHELKTLYTGDTTRIGDSVIIEGYVTSTDQFGNFYKELVIQDSSDAICIMIDASYMFTSFPIGQKVYVKCGGLMLGNSNDVIKLGNTYTEYGIVNFGRIQGDVVIANHIIKTCDNAPVEPQEITLSQIDDGIVYKLVKINAVQFKSSELPTTWADAIGLESINHYIVDQDNNSLIVRTSGYSSFARDSLPNGSGYIIGVLGKYGSDYQLYVRNPDDAVMGDERFAEPIYKDFEDGSIYSDGWFNKIVKGQPWTLGTIGGNYAQCRSYNGSTNIETESWYISPALDLSNYSAPVVSFRNACNYSGALIETKYSTDYDGTSDPNTATWTDLPATLSSGNWAWVNSGDLTLPTNVKHVAFVYFGTNSDGRTWEIDDILIEDAGK